jgi:murein DD-endopeptidase MepM/ murein hydrolase activator NlpD
MTQAIIKTLQKHIREFHPVVHFDFRKEKLLLLDLSKNNTEFSADTLNDTERFSLHINQKLKSAGAKFGVGGYNEHRELYSRSKVFDANADEEPRRLHLGIDIWGKPYTAVMCPFDAVVHSCAFNNNFGDYGATIILSHVMDDVSFHTLYGHLSLNSIKNLRGGENIQKGDIIGEFGIPAENGQWPPHLHFQIIIDMEIPGAVSRAGDYPGVCKFSEKEKYLDNCPDPDLILQMMKYAKM